MKILLVSRHFYPFRRPSGVTTFVKELISELKIKGINISVACLKKSQEKKHYNYKGIQVYKFSQYGLLRYIRIVRKVKSDHVLFISSMSTLPSLILWWGLLRIITLSKKVSLFQSTNFFKFKKSRVMSVFTLLFKNIFVTNKRIEKYFKHSCKYKTELIYPGLKIKKYKYKERKSINKIMFFGHMVYTKGVDIFAKIPPHFPNIKFYIVAGRGRKKSDIIFEQKLLDKVSKIKNLNLIGFVKKPLEVMSESDLLILPYRTSGGVLGISQSAIEAMSMGIPVMGTKTSSLKPVINHNNNGFIINTNISDIVKKIKLLLGDPNLYKKFSINAIDTVKQKFDISKNTDILINFLK